MTKPPLRKIVDFVDGAAAGRATLECGHTKFTIAGRKPPVRAWCLLCMPVRDRQVFLRVTT